MKNKILSISILASMTLTGCFGCSDNEKLAEMKSPVILVGKSKEARYDGTLISITVKAGDGTFETFYDYPLAINIYQYISVGDTIK